MFSFFCFLSIHLFISKTKTKDSYLFFQWDMHQWGFLKGKSRKTNQRFSRKHLFFLYSDNTELNERAEEPNDNFQGVTTRKSLQDQDKGT